MTKIEAQQAGVAAFFAGKGRAPALNNEFTVAVCKLGFKEMMARMDDYTHGWTIAHLADNAPLPTMPSVGELERIIEA